MAEVTRRPQSVFIARGMSELSEKLYAAEAERTEIIKKCAHIWRDLMVECGSIRTRSLPYWPDTVAQALYDTLEAFEPRTSRLAAEAWLHDHPPVEQERDAPTT